MKKYADCKHRINEMTNNSLISICQCYGGCGVSLMPKIKTNAYCYCNRHKNILAHQYSELICIKVGCEDFENR